MLAFCRRVVGPLRQINVTRFYGKSVREDIRNVVFLNKAKTKKKKKMKSPKLFRKVFIMVLVAYEALRAKMV